VCRAIGLVPVVDPTNDDPGFVRNRVRHELLPLACAVAGRDLVPVLARQAAVLAEEAGLLDDLAADIDPADASSLARAPVTLARRAARRWLRDDRSYPPDLAAVERVLAVARGETTATDVAPGRRVRRSRGTLSVVPISDGSVRATGSVPGR
jgi:tRNA(Ile)-lysidine synthase